MIRRYSNHRVFVLTMILVAPLSGAIDRSLGADPPSPSIYDYRDLEKLERTFQRLAQDVRQSVVAISTYRELNRGGGRVLMVPNSQGAGFVWRAGGLIATNHHLVEGADRIDVVLHSGREYRGELVQFDPRSDLAVIKIDARDLRVAPLGDLGEVRVGRWAFTVGNPFGLGNRSGNTSVSFGTVSAVGQSLEERLDPEGKDRYYGNLIQTDASINPGNSGGPLFDIRGRVIGIATAMLTGSGVNEGVGFAIPISARTRRILNTLADGDVVRYGYLGVTDGRPSRQQLLRMGVPGGRGALIVTNTGDSAETPAERAGLRSNDIITEVDGVSVTRFDDLVRVIGGTPVGSEVEVAYYRDGRRLLTQVRLEERLQTAAARLRSGETTEGLRFKLWRGVLLVEPTDALLLSAGLPRDKPGLYVAELPRGSLLYRQGLRQGAFIISVNGKRIRTLEDFAACEKRARKSLRLELRRGGIVVVPR